VAVVLPVLLAMVFRRANAHLWSVLSWTIAIALPIYVVARALYLWVRLDDSLVRTTLRDLRPGWILMPVGTEAPWKVWPFLTTALVLANVSIFYLGVDPWTYAFDSTEPWNWPWSNWTSQFLHADASHLWGNMVFLWIFGSALEGRIRRGRLLAFYLLAGTASNALSAIGYLPHGGASGVGASGAIAGLMGLYLVRCYFSRVSFGVPIFGPLGYALPVVLRIQIHPFVLLTLYFLMDLSGARATMVGLDSDVDYWAHVGGYVFGLTIGYATGLYREGLVENLAFRRRQADESGEYGQSHAANTALLEIEPDDVDALLARARAQSRFYRRETAKEDYCRVIQMLLTEQRRRAAEVFLEYFEKYLVPMPIDQQLALTPALAERGDLNVAARCLELAAEAPGADPELRATALLYEAKLLIELGFKDAAVKVYEELVCSHPTSPRSEVARSRLAQLRGNDVG
jgi:membrane associated rhomboid family serine protease